MTVMQASLPEVLLIFPTVYRDDRGAFCETWNLRGCADAGLPERWVQDNFSFSRRNVIRGLHYQMVQPQAKLVRVVHGAVLDVAVDIRRDSPTFGQHVAVELNAENGLAVFIPCGFAHGFAVLSEHAAVTYKVTDYYYPAGERTLLWNDPDLAIAWPVSAQDAILSAKDRNGQRLCEAEVFEWAELHVR